RFDLDNKPGVSNLLTLLSIFSGESIPALESRLAGQGYGVLKVQTAESVIAFLEPIQARFHALRADESALDQILADGAAKARARAEPTLHRAFEVHGFLPRR
ncbi:MAG TPA: tryptophan--tRNA ligase, partial [Halothiobacillus sp.]